MAKIMKIETIALLSVCTILSAIADAQQLPNEIQMSNISENLVDGEKSYSQIVIDSIP